jgi:uncharacterized protein YggE
VEFRSLTYSLADEEAAKERATANAMHNATGRADSALKEKGQKLGTLRYANLDVKQLMGVARLESPQFMEFALLQDGALGPSGAARRQASTPPIAVARPEKITVTATVQCIFQIQ